MECPIPQRNELPLTGEYGAARILSGRGAIRGSSIGSQFELDELERILPRFCDTDCFGYTLFLFHT